MKSSLNDRKQQALLAVRVYLHADAVGAVACQRSCNLGLLEIPQLERPAGRTGNDCRFV